MAELVAVIQIFSGVTVTRPASRQKMSRYGTA